MSNTLLKRTVKWFIQQNSSLYHIIQHHGVVQNAVGLHYQLKHTIRATLCYNLNANDICSVFVEPQVYESFRQPHFQPDAFFLYFGPFLADVSSKYWSTKRNVTIIQHQIYQNICDKHCTGFLMRNQFAFKVLVLGTQVFRFRILQAGDRNALLPLRVSSGLASVN